MTMSNDSYPLAVGDLHHMIEIAIRTFGHSRVIRWGLGRDHMLQVRMSSRVLGNRRLISSVLCCLRFFDVRLCPLSNSKPFSTVLVSSVGRLIDPPSAIRRGISARPIGIRRHLPLTRGCKETQSAQHA
jgi:hypothetical protein